MYLALAFAIVDIAAVALANEETLVSGHAAAAAVKWREYDGAFVLGSDF